MIKNIFMRRSKVFLFALLSISIALVVIFVFGKEKHPSAKVSRASAGQKTKSIPGETEAAPTVIETDFVALASQACDCITDFENELSEEGRTVLLNSYGRVSGDSFLRSFSEADREVYTNGGKKSKTCLEELFRSPSFKAVKQRTALHKAIGEHCSPFAEDWVVLLRP